MMNIKHSGVILKRIWKYQELYKYFNPAINFCNKIIEVLVLLKCCSIIYNSEKYNHLIALTCLSIIWGII